MNQKESQYNYRYSRQRVHRTFRRLSLFVSLLVFSFITLGCHLVFVEQVWGDIPDSFARLIFSIIMMTVIFFISCYYILSPKYKR